MAEVSGSSPLPPTRRYRIANCTVMSLTTSRAVAQLPSALAIRCGFTDVNLPVGLQIVGKRFAELTVLQAARAFEQVRPWADRQPPL